MKQIMAEQGRTNKWLASKLDLSPAMVSAYVNGHSELSLAKAFRIAQVLGVQMESLVKHPVA